MKTISGIIQEYTGETDHENEAVVSYTCKTTEEYRIKLTHLALHLGTKKTRLASELFEASIDEALEQVIEDFDSNLRSSFDEEMHNYQQNR